MKPPSNWLVLSGHYEAAAHYSPSMTRRALSIHYTGLGLFALLLAFLAWKFPLLEWVAAAQRRVQELGPAATLVYPLLYAGCNVLLLPAGVLNIGAGFFFGLWTGTALILIGNLLAAAIAFAFSRSIARKWVEHKLLANPRWQAMDAVIERRGGKIVFLTQLHPLFPTSLLNYFYGITRLPFWPCLGWIALGQLPGIFLYAYLGSIGQLGVRVVSGEKFPASQTNLLWLAGFFLTIVTTLALARYAIGVLREIDERAAALTS